MPRSRTLTALAILVGLLGMVLPVARASAAGTTIDIIYAPASPIVANTNASFMAHITPFASGRSVSWYVNGVLVGHSTTNPNGNASLGLTFGAGGYSVRAVLDPAGGVDWAQSQDVLLIVTQDPGRLPDAFRLEKLDHPPIAASGTDAQIAVNWAATDASQVTIVATVVPSNDSMTLTIKTPDGSDLAPGAFTSDSSNLMTRVDNSGSGCGSASTTRVEIETFERDASSMPNSFALSFSFTCEGWPMVGFIRYNTTTPIASLSLPSGSPVFESVVSGASGTPHPFTITNTGGVDVAIATIGLGGAASGDFARSDDGCSGVTLGPAETCTVDVSFAPATPGPKHADLVVTSDLGLSPGLFDLGGQALIPEAVGTPSVVPEQVYFPYGLWYEATVSPNPQENFGECLVDGNHLDGSGPDVNGVVRCISARPGPGSHTLVVRYLGSFVRGTATSPQATFIVDPTTSTSISVSAGVVPANLPVTVTASVAFSGDVSYPGGTLRITDSSTNAVIASGVVGPDHRTVKVTKTFTAGMHHLVAAYLGIAGIESASSGATDLTSTAVDLVPPTVTTPVAGAPAGALLAGKIGVRLAWTGADAMTGVDHYLVRRQVDGGAWSSAAPSATPSQVQMLAPGHAYRFAIQAVDGAGNESGWAYGTTFRLSAISQSSAAVHYVGRWYTSLSTIWWGGSARSSTARRATASYTFTGRTIAWVGLKAVTRGKAQVFINGVLKATVDLYSATTKKQLIVWSGSWSTSATRTITIKVLGTSGRPRVDVDGFIVGS